MTARAIDRLIAEALYTLELCGRSDGWIIQLTRQEFDAIVDDLKAAERLSREREKPIPA
jgi:hypothetical protein